MEGAGSSGDVSEIEVSGAQSIASGDQIPEPVTCSDVKNDHSDPEKNSLSAVNLIDETESTETQVTPSCISDSTGSKKVGADTANNEELPIRSHAKYSEKTSNQPQPNDTPVVSSTVSSSDACEIADVDVEPSIVDGSSSNFQNMESAENGSSLEERHSEPGEKVDEKNELCNSEEGEGSSMVITSTGGLKDHTLDEVSSESHKSSEAAQVESNSCEVEGVAKENVGSDVKEAQDGDEDPHVEESHPSDEPEVVQIQIHPDKDKNNVNSSECEQSTESRSVQNLAVQTGSQEVDSSEVLYNKDHFSSIRSGKETGKDCSVSKLADTGECSSSNLESKKQHSKEDSTLHDSEKPLSIETIDPNLSDHCPVNSTEVQGNEGRVGPRESQEDEISTRHLVCFSNPNDPEPLLTSDCVCESENNTKDISEVENCPKEVSENPPKTSVHQEKSDKIGESVKQTSKVFDADISSDDVSTSSIVASCVSGNGDKDIQAIALADVDNVCNEETAENETENEEADPFFSCNDKDKDTDSQMVVDDQERETVSPMDIDHTDTDSQDKGDRSKTPSDAGEADAANSIDKTSTLNSNNASHHVANTVDDTGNATDDTVNTADDTTNAADEETITADKSSTGDEEVCIVPDTAPRVLTDKEKADAVEKAAKVSSTPSKEDVSSEIPDVSDSDKSNQDASESNQKTPSAEENNTALDESNTDVPLPVKKVKVPKPVKMPGIHVVSAASLLEQSILEESDKDRCADKNASESREEQTCCQCNKVIKCKYKLKDQEKMYVCEDECYAEYRKKSQSEGSSLTATSAIRARNLDRSFFHKCGQCREKVVTTHDKYLTWETMDFCNEECLEKYQRDLGSHCANCKGPVQAASLGKYCVRFGYDMKQFCLASCLEDFKKGLKVCSYCQKDISAGLEGFLAPVGDKGQFKDFCSQICMEKYDQMSNNTAPPETVHECAVCNNERVVKVEVIIDSKFQKLCSEPCFAAFKFVNAIVADQCDMCKKYFDKDKTENFSVFYDDAPHSFCCKTCMNVYILAKRKIVPCTWCKVKKYNFDMIKRVLSSGQVLMMCSLHCMSLYQVSVSAVSSKKTKCDKCNANTQSQYHLTMSDATIRNFCSYNCVMSFQAQFSKPPIPVPGSETTPHPLGTPRRINARRSAPVGEKEASSKANTMPVISSVTSLAPSNGQPTTKTPNATISASKPVVNETLKTVYKQQVIIKPPPPPERQNRGVQVKPIMNTKGVTCRPHSCAKETQTEENVGTPILVPIPVPIYIPVPMQMYSAPYPVPVPFPLPIPVPIFIPTTRNSAKGIFNEIMRIQDKTPNDPCEADMLMIADIVAQEKQAENDEKLAKNAENDETESEEDDSPADDNTEVNAAEPVFNPQAAETNNTYNEDIIQMALKIASELDEPAVDFEAAVAPSTIAQTTPQNQQQLEQSNDESEVDESEPDAQTKSARGKKRTLRSKAGIPQKRGRRSSGSDHSNVGSSGASATLSDSTTPSKAEQIEKPDVHMCLKFTFGVNAWKHWVTQKNAELEKAAGNNRKLKLFKTEILQLTADELNFSLCLFVKEVRKPNGSEYAPDTIYYLCLGIQQYLIEHGRVENIFTDTYYEKFTECLDEVARKFTVLYNDSQFVVTRVEEEHLWESKQLGAHSPYVLLSTLMFFHTKHFNLTTVDEHTQLSFSHIMKHWKRHPNAPSNAKTPGSRNVLLRFYPPQASLGANSKKKKVYEQQENEENPLRCPVKLYEFYLSKCPESVRTRNDVFYLLPERSCVPDSPVWYSTMALGRDQLQKMLNRIKMVKEINVALLNG